MLAWVACLTTLSGTASADSATPTPKNTAALSAVAALPVVASNELRRTIPAAPGRASAAARGVQAEAADSSWQLNKGYALGINRYRLDHDTRVLGWQLGDRWYFGRQKGLDSGLTLVWQQRANQVSLSKDGLRLTRRF